MACVHLQHKLRVPGGLQLQLFRVCSTVHVDVTSTDKVCEPGTLGIYFERTVDTSFNVIHLVGLLWMTWHTNNLQPAKTRSRFCAINKAQVKGAFIRCFCLLSIHH